MRRLTDERQHMTYPTPDWTNVLNNGVVGDGVTDDTVAIQALLTAAETSGGTLYFPAGLYVVSAQLNYSSAKPLVVYGDFSAGQVDIGTQGTCIISKTGNGSSPSHVFDFENSSMVYVHDIDIYQAATITFNAADDFVVPDDLPVGFVVEVLANDGQGHQRQPRAGLGLEPRDNGAQIFLVPREGRVDGKMVEDAVAGQVALAQGGVDVVGADEDGDGVGPLGLVQRR